MKVIRLLHLLALALLSACPVRTALAAVPEGAVAVVNGVAVSRQEFGETLVRVLGRPTVEGMIDRALVVQEAEKLGITVTDEEIAQRRDLEVDLRMRKAQTAARMTADEFQQLAESEGLDMNKFRQEVLSSLPDGRMRTELLAEKVLARRIEIPDGKLRRYFERTRGRRFLAAHIFVPNEKDARVLLRALEEKPELWLETVLTISLDRASARYKGRLPLVPADSRIGRALDGMKAGELTLFKSDLGWHVLRFVKEVPPVKVQFDQVKEQLRQEVLLDAVARMTNPWLSTLHERAQVVLNLSPDPEVRAILGLDVAAFVNGHPVSRDALAEALIEEFGGKMIWPYIERELIFDAAKRSGVQVSERELRGRMEQVAQGLFAEDAAGVNMDLDRFREFLVGEGIEPEQYRQGLLDEFVHPLDVKATLLAEKMVAADMDVAEDEIQTGYRERYAGRIDAREIVVGSAQQAEAVLKKLNAGADFLVLALTETEAAGVWMNNAMVEGITPLHPFYPHVKDLREDGVSGVFAWGGKYHILKVLKRNEPRKPPPLESVRESLRSEMWTAKARARIRTWIEELKADADIEIGI